jgi:uncharacterized protein YjbI with pentapeptide repeats
MTGIKWHRFICFFIFGVMLFLKVNIAESNCKNINYSTELKTILKAHKDWLHKGRPGISQRKIDLSIIIECIKGPMNLSKADLRYADLTNARLDHTNFLDAKLEYANLTSASLVGAQLNRAKLNNADLTNADLSLATLIEAELSDSNITGANFRRIDLEKTLYEPIGIPNRNTLGQIKNLSTVTFSQGQQSSLVELRAALKENGLRNLERQATYAIEKEKTEHASIPEKIKIVLFDWTCQYGLNPIRGVYIILFLILVHAVIYFYAIKRQQACPDIIYIEQVYEDQENPDDFSELTFGNIMLIALKFSIYSAFEIGWGEFTIGEWFKRLQHKEYTFQSHRWIRTISGTQSLVSTYLLAITTLSYFGRPFG